MTIVKLTRASREAAKDISSLLAQLREDPSEHKAALSELRDITTNKNVVFIVAKDGKKIVGMAMLYVMQKLGKRIAYVEDVVVLSEYRGRGLGEKIMRAIIATARAKKVRTLNLTSRPARVAANKLYQKLGFEQKETNVYRMKFK